MLGSGVSFLGCWLILALLGSVRILHSVTDLAVLFAPVFLGLGIAFVLYGIGYHVAINMAHWKEVREDEQEDQAILSGRKRFERRKNLHPGLPTTKLEATEEEPGVFDALD
jgi:hypothetical protein